jgi:hypothetical protein
MFCRSLFVLFLLAIVLSVHLRYTVSHCPFGIFKLFLSKWIKTLLEASLLILVNIKWHIKWKYLIQKFHDICLSYYFKFQTIRNKKYPWWPCLLSNRKEMMKSYRGSSIDASCNISLYFPKLFQRRWFLSIDQPKTRIAYSDDVS